jgi:hypothetical protein
MCHKADFGHIPSHLANVLLEELIDRFDSQWLDLAV